MEQLVAEKQEEMRTLSEKMPEHHSYSYDQVLVWIGLSSSHQHCDTGSIAQSINSRLEKIMAKWNRLSQEVKAFRVEHQKMKQMFETEQKIVSLDVACARIRKKLNRLNFAIPLIRLSNDGQIAWNDDYDMHFSNQCLALEDIERDYKAVNDQNVMDEFNQLIREDWLTCRRLLEKLQKQLKDVESTMNRKEMDREKSRLTKAIHLDIMAWSQSQAEILAWLADKSSQNNIEIGKKIEERDESFQILQSRIPLYDPQDLVLSSSVQAHITLASFHWQNLKIQIFQEMNIMETTRKMVENDLLQQEQRKTALTLVGEINEIISKPIQKNDHDISIETFENLDAFYRQDISNIKSFWQNGLAQYESCRGRLAKLQLEAKGDLAIIQEIQFSVFYKCLIEKILLHRRDLVHILCEAWYRTHQNVTEQGNIPDLDTTIDGGRAILIFLRTDPWKTCFPDLANDSSSDELDARISELVEAASTQKTALDQQPANCRSSPSLEIHNSEIEELEKLITTLELEDNATLVDAVADGLSKTCKKLENFTLQLNPDQKEEIERVSAVRRHLNELSHRYRNVSKTREFHQETIKSKYLEGLRREEKERQENLGSMHYEELSVLYQELEERIRQWHMQLSSNKDALIENLWHERIEDATRDALNLRNTCQELFSHRDVVASDASGTQKLERAHFNIAKKLALMEFQSKINSMLNQLQRSLRRRQHAVTIERLRRAPQAVE